MSTALLTIYTDKQRYRPGDDIHGYIVMNAERPMLLGDVLIEVEGHQNVKIVRSSGQATEVCQSKYTFLSFSESLLYGKEGSNGFVHGQHPLANTLYAPGVHQLSFSFRLPEDVLGSFNYDNSHAIFSDKKKAIVSYLLRASLVQPATKKPLTFESPFTVATVPSTLLAPLHVIEDKSLSFLCCISKGSSLVSVYSDKNVYVAGEVLYVTVDVDHTHGKVDGHGIELSLQRMRLLCVAGHVDSSKSTEASTRSTEMITRGTKYRTGMKLQIPVHLDATYSSPNIYVIYGLKVRVQLSRAADVQILCPITVFSAEM